MIVACTHVDHVGCTLMEFHSSAKVVENDGTREMGSRVQCNECGDETNQRLVEFATSAKLVSTSDRSRFKPENVMADELTDSSRIH